MSRPTGQVPAAGTDGPAEPPGRAEATLATTFRSMIAVGTSSWTQPSDRIADDASLSAETASTAPKLKGCSGRRIFERGLMARGLGEVGKCDRQRSGHEAVQATRACADGQDTQPRPPPRAWTCPLVAPPVPGPCNVPASQFASLQLGAVARLRRMLRPRRMSQPRPSLSDRGLRL